MPEKTAEKILDRLRKSIHVYDGNTEIHHMYLYVAVAEWTIWDCGSNDVNALKLAAQREAKKVLNKYRKACGFRHLPLSDIPDFPIEVE